MSSVVFVIFLLTELHNFLLDFLNNVVTCESFFLRSNRISNRIGRPIRFRIQFSNRISRIYHASRNTV